MPYQTPTASSYTMIKRLQATISGKAAADPTKFRAPSTYGGYFAGLSLVGLPPNAIGSNKFQPPKVMTLEEAINNILAEKSIAESAITLHKYLSHTTRSQYEYVFQRLNGGYSIELQISATDYLILPYFDDDDSAVITPPPMSSSRRDIYIMYPGSCLVIHQQGNDDINISYDGDKYYYESGTTHFDLQDNGSVPGFSGVRFKRGSAEIASNPLPFPFPPSSSAKNDNDILWFKGVPLDWVHPAVLSAGVPVIPGVNSWILDSTDPTSNPLPDGLTLNQETGHITGTVNTVNVPATTHNLALASNQTELIPFTVKIIPDLKLKEITDPKTVEADGYSNALSPTSIFIPLNTQVSFRPFEIDPDYPGSLYFFPSGVPAGAEIPITWAILPSLPNGLSMDPDTGIISGSITQFVDADYRVGVRDQQYPWDSTRARYFTLYTIRPIDLINTTPISCFVGESKTVDIKPLINMTDVRTPFIFSTTTTLPSTITLTEDGFLTFANPTTESVYDIEIKIQDGFNGVRDVRSPIKVSVQERRSLVLTTRPPYGLFRDITISRDGSTILASSGDGLYVSTDSGATWRLFDSKTVWGCVASSADGSKLVACLSYGQIYTSTDSGVNWIARESNRDWKSVASSNDGTKLVACVQGGQIYTSTDSGVNWIARESNREWRAVASSADGTKLIACVISGQIYTSTDSGVTWTARKAGRYATLSGTDLWGDVACSSDGNTLVACNLGRGKIYTSTDSGLTWIARAIDKDWGSISISGDASRVCARVEDNFNNNIYVGFFGLEIDALVYQINQNLSEINTLLNQGVAASIITQGAATSASQFVLSGGSASSSQFYLILSGGSP